MMEIGSGLYPEEPRVILVWNETSKTETPIHVQHGYVNGRVYPQVPVKMPANVAAMLHDDSGYDVSITPIEPEEGEDAEIEEAVINVELQAKAKTLIDQTVDKLKDALAGADLALLRAALVAEEAEGEGKTRKSAIEAIEAAIDAHPDQIAALAKGPPAINEQAS